MEYESHVPQRPLAEGLHLPKGALEAGLGRKDRAEKTPVARVALGSEVRPSGDQRQTGNRASEAVSTWKRLIEEDRPVTRRMSEDALPLEGQAEIPLQAAPHIPEVTSAEHLDTVMPFPMEHVTAAGTAAGLERTGSSDQPPDMPPPIAPWIGGGRPNEQTPVGANVVPLAAAAAVVGERWSSGPGQAEAVRQQTQPKAEWLQADTLAAGTPAAERLASQPLTELLAVPAAAVALKTAAASPSAERAPIAAGPNQETAMSKDQLMDMARIIMVDGVPLSETYQSKQIDDEGLRAIVETYLRGGDIKRQLQAEMVERQKQFERDPFNRKRSRGPLRDTLSGVSSKVADATGSLAKSASAVAGKAGKSLAGGSKQVQHKVNDGSEARQWAGIGAVVVIWAVILWLVFG